MAPVTAALMMTFFMGNFGQSLPLPLSWSGSDRTTVV
jgi:hypothetical protein